MQGYKRDMSTYRCHYVKMLNGFARVFDDVTCRVGSSTGCLSSSISRNIGYFSSNWDIKVNLTRFL